MSSDEGDEFFDAAETTSVKSLTEEHLEKLDFIELKAEQINNEFEKEEQKLLEQKRLAEERRHQEDVKLLAEFELLRERKEEAAKKHEAKIRVLENERRRKRMENLRDNIARHGHTTDQLGSESDLSADNSEDVRLNKLRCESSGSLPNISTLSSHPEKPESCTSGGQGSSFTSSADTNTKKTSFENLHTQFSKFLSSSSNDITSHRGYKAADSSIPATNMSMSAYEPDIVQSTKTRSLERAVQTQEPLTLSHGLVADSSHDKSSKLSMTQEVMQVINAQFKSDNERTGPVAPPRRKKRIAASDPQLDQSVKTNPSNLLDAVEPSDVIGLAEGSGQSLDIQSATHGNCVVTANEENSSRAAKSHYECNSDEESSLLSTSLSTSSPVSVPDDQCACPKSEENMVTIPKPNDQDVTLSIPRPRSNSGTRFLTDEEILQQVQVLNLDTGECIPLNLAESKLPACVNPLSLHIMRRTKEYSSDSSLHKNQHSEGEEKKDGESMATVTISTIKSLKPNKRRGMKIKRLFARRVQKRKMNADKNRHGDESSEDDEHDERVKIKAASSNKGPYDFDLLVPVQELGNRHQGAIWTMKFSPCGRLLATGGQDNRLRVWVLKSSYSYFEDMRRKYCDASKISPALSEDSLNSQSETSESSSLSESQLMNDEEDIHAPFMNRPICVYKGHTADLLDVSWSKNYFILSSSMDKTVRLWHISRKECLCCFQHIDFVTAIAFHPKDDRYFISGSLDGKLRLWNIPEKKVALWNEVNGQIKLITAANFCLGGKFAVVGTYDGRCIFYNIEHLKYWTQINVRSTRGKNARGRKITSIESMPHNSKVLVTSNDSRIRLYDLSDLTLTCKFKGCANNSSQIKATFSSSGKYIICGSEDHFVYIWRTKHENYKFSSARKDRNDYWEGIKAHSAPVTNAIFAPNPSLIIKAQFEFVDEEEKDCTRSVDVRGEVIVSADFTGAIRVFINKFKPGSG